MAINKVVYGDDTLIDLTTDTVTSDAMLYGTSAHDASGNVITGSVITHNVVDNLTSTSTDDALSANQGKVLKDLVDTKTSNKGTVTSISVKLNGETKGTVTSSGEIDLGFALTNPNQFAEKYIYGDTSMKLGGSATGIYAVAHGLNTSATGQSSHAEGDGTKATNGESHAEGWQTIASGNRAHSEGHGTIASGSDQHVSGRFNVEDSSQYAYIIGNGTSDTSRSNALTVDWNGNITVSGNVTDGEGNILSDVSKLDNTSNVSPLLNSADGNIKSVRLIGNSHKSKNLLKLDVSSQTVNGITFTINADGTILANGTSSADVIFWIVDKIDLKANTYKIVGFENGSTDMTVQLYKRTDANRYGSPNIYDYRDGGIGTITEGTYNVRIYIKSGKTLNNVVAHPMLTTNTSATYNDYEPSGIINPSGNVTSHSRNLCNGIEQGTFDVYGTESASDIRVRTSDYIKIKPNTRYTMSCSANAQMSASYYSKNDGTQRNGTSGWVSSSYTFTSGTNDNYLKCMFRHSDDSNISASEITDYQFEEGNATDYVPFGSSIVHTDRPMLSVNDIKNELIVNADGSGKFVQRVARVELNTSNLVGISGTGYVQFTNTLSKIPWNSDIICNIYDKATTVSIGTTNDKSIRYGDNSTNLYVKDTDITTKEQARAFFTDGKAYAIVILTTPIETDLTQTEVHALLSLQTFENETYVDADGCSFEIKYFLNNNIGNAISLVNTKTDGSRKDLSYYEDNGFLSRNLYKLIDGRHTRCSYTINNDGSVSIIPTNNDAYIYEIGDSGQSIITDYGFYADVSNIDNIRIKLTNPQFDKCYVSLWDANGQYLTRTKFTTGIINVDVSNASYISLRIGIETVTVGQTYTTKVMVSESPTDYDWMPYAPSNAEIEKELKPTRITVDAGTNISVNANSYVFKNSKTVCGSLRLDSVGTLSQGQTIAILQYKPINIQYFIGINTGTNAMQPLILTPSGNLTLFSSNTIQQGNTLIVPINYITKD